MSKFMANREPLFVVPVGPVNKSNAVSVVGTTLSRLKALGMARSADGMWTATGRSTSPSDETKVGGAGNRRRRRDRR